MAVIVPGIGTAGHPAAVSFSDAFAVADGQIIRGLGNIRDAFAVGLAFNNVFICMHCSALHCGPGIQQLYATSAFRGRGDLFCLLTMRSQEILCKSFHLSDSDSNIVLCEFSFMSQIQM